MWADRHNRVSDLLNLRGARVCHRQVRRHVVAHLPHQVSAAAGDQAAKSRDFAGALTLTADTTLDATTSVTTASVDGANALTINSMRL